MSQDGLDAGVVSLYAAPLPDFIARRDALAKKLRGAGDREAASAVKSLRKPSRTAWALNRVVHEQPAAMSSLDAAIADYVEAQAGAGDVRTAMSALRASVREYASRAAGEARSAGLNVDETDLSTAILAVLGTPDSYDAFRRGCMADIPDAGGLDFLGSLPIRPRLEVSASPAATRPHADPAEVAALREELRLAGAAVEAARSGVGAADAALADAEAAVAEATEVLEEARSRLTAAQQRREFARRTRDAAAMELREAESGSREAERRLVRLDSGSASRDVQEVPTAPSRRE